MAEFLSTKAIGCIGKCTSGLTPEDLDYITDNIHRTLSHTQGIEIFETFLKESELTDGINCLNLYKTCCNFIKAAETCSESRRELPLEVLIDHVKKVQKMAEGVTQIDGHLMRSYNEAISSGSKTDLLDVLKNTRTLCQDSLRNAHVSFKEYALKPCPLIK